MYAEGMWLAVRERLTNLGRKQDGFTLIELIVVVAILGILAVVLTPRVLDAVQNARVNAALSSAKQIQLGFERYLIEDSSGKYPLVTISDTDGTNLNNAIGNYVAIDVTSISNVSYSSTDGTTYKLSLTFVNGDIDVTITPDAIIEDK